MKKGYTIAVACLFICAVFLPVIMGCNQTSIPGGDGFGLVKILLTDYPLGDKEVEEININIKRVEIHREDTDWETILSYEEEDGSGSQEFEILVLKDGIMVVLGEAELPTGVYTQIRIILDEDNTIKVDGAEKPLKIPSGEQTGIKLVGNFEVSSDHIAVIKLDFDAEASVVLKGNGSYMLKPTVTFEVEYIEEGLWPLQFGTPESDFATAVTAQSLSKIYVGGYTGGDLNGNTSAGGNDYFVIRYDAAGYEQWLVQNGTIADERVEAVTADLLGNVYAVGDTKGDLAGTNAGSNDLFVAKYSKDGMEEWIRQLGTVGGESAYGAAADKSNNIYATGVTGGSLDGNQNAGGTDIFLVKYDANGNKMWTRQLGSSEDDRGQAAATDTTGNIFLAGYAAGELPEGTLPGPVNTHAGGRDLFVAKYDTDGNLQWVRQIGTATDDSAFGVATDLDGNVYAVGDTRDSLDGNTNAGGADAFIVKYDTDGNLLWSQLIGSDKTEFATGVTTDVAGSVFVTGYTSGNLDGNTNAGVTDMFLVKFDSTGTKLWTQLFGTDSDDRSSDITIDITGDVYLSGHTWGSYGSFTNAGDSDLLIGKFDTDGELD